ncbi:MAG TPA: YbhN family protein [Gammaproteobacteria bacterium]|nr:YbhN family protein [Gammaproteobacteria bacterium]
MRSVRAVRGPELLRAGLFAAASYLCLTMFDWLGLRYAGKPLAYRRAALGSFVSLSIGHNLGFAALSSGAIRYRYYRRWGLDAPDVARVILFCGATVGLGLAVLGGIAIVLRPDLAQDMLRVERPVVLAVGGAGQPDRAVEIPADDQNRMPGEPERLLQPCKVRRCVDQDRDLSGRRSAPAIVSRARDARALGRGWTARRHLREFGELRVGRIRGC